MVAKLKKIDSMKLLTIISIVLITLSIVFVPDVVALAASDGQVKQKLKSAAKSIQGVLTAIVVLVGIIAALMILVKKMPSIDDPHSKNEMWKSIGNVGMAVGAAAAVIWLLPWMYGLFK